MGRNNKLLPSKLKTYAPILIILLMALFLRLYNIQYMEFKGDEAFNSIKALNLVNNKEFPLTASVGTTGINEPPIFIYILAIPFLFSKNPIAAAAFIAILNVAAILLCYLFIKKFYNKRAAIIASLFYAVSPWQIVFSRKIWAQDLLAIFVIFFIFFVYNAIYAKKRPHIIYALASLGLLVQIHLSAIYFILLAIMAIAIYWKRIDKRCLIVGIILFLLSFTPYFMFQVKNNFIDAKTALSLIDKQSGFQANAFLIPFKIVSTKGFDGLFGSSLDNFEKTAFKVNFLDILAMAVLFLSIAFLLVYPKKSIILIVWLSIGTLFLAFSKVPLDTHYFASFFPLYFIIMGNGLDIFVKVFPVKAKYFIYPAIALIIIYQIAFNLSFLNFIKISECINGEYGMPYKYRLNNIESSLEKFKIDASNINELSCNCNKCDIKAAEFIIGYVKS